MSMKEDRRRSTVINEGGSEIKIWLNTKEDLLIEIKNLKSFHEQRRLIMFIKTMLKMYLSYILKPKTTLQRRLFEGVDAYVNEVYEEEEIVEHVRRITPVFQIGLRDLIDHPIVGEVRGVGLLGGVELVKNKKKS